MGGTLSRRSASRSLYVSARGAVRHVGCHESTGATDARKARMSRIMSSPGSEEWAKTDAAIAQIDRSKKKRVPHDRHEQRESALYVDPISPDRWNRPSAAI